VITELPDARNSQGAINKVRSFLLPKPGDLVQFLVTTNIILFITALLVAPEGINYTLNLSYFLAPATNVLFILGASGTLPVFAEDRWWTLITANYLHGSLLHLIFNVSSLRAVGDITMPIYGSARLFLIYSVGGIAAMGMSSLVGIPLTLGASGAICALIGAMSYDDWRTSKGNLKKRIASVGIWIVLIIVIGVALPNVNNWAHGIGFGTGFIMGMFLWPQTTQNETTVFRFAAIACMLLTITTLIYGLLFS
jgi:rhomboid protease GluP